jgi:acetyl esterase
LEPAAQAFVEATAEPPYPFQVDPAEGRRRLDALQSGATGMPAVDEEWVTVGSRSARPRER